MVGHTIPRDAEVLSVTLNGASVEDYRVRETNRGQEVLVDAPTTGPQTPCRLSPRRYSRRCAPGQTAESTESTRAVSAVCARAGTAAISAMTAMNRMRRIGGWNVGRWDEREADGTRQLGRGDRAVGDVRDHVDRGVRRAVRRLPVQAGHGGAAVRQPGCRRCADSRGATCDEDTQAGQGTRHRRASAATRL